MTPLAIGKRLVGPGFPAYIIAELSANHGQDFELAVRIIEAMKASGADAVKVQTYTPDTLTLNCRSDPFVIKGGTLWDGRTLHDLYKEAYMPWEWQPKLKAIAQDLGMDFFSTPFDTTSVDFLEQIGVPCYKIASFELVDLPLIRKVAATGRPIIMSTGMATLAEIDEAVQAARAAGCEQLALLKCNSGYPAPPMDMNLRTIPHLSDAFDVPVGLSDHTLDLAVPVAAVSLGACIIEKHFTLDRSLPGPDSAFSLAPSDFKAMVSSVRIAEQALGKVNYSPTTKEHASRALRKSLFAAEDIREGEPFTALNVRCVRPGNGLHPRHMHEVLTAIARSPIKRGTPLHWAHLR